MNTLDAVALFSSLHRMTNLKTLKVAFNYINGPESAAVISLIETLPLTHAKELDVACSIGAAVFMKLAPVLPYCTSLKVLRLAVTSLKMKV